MNSCQHWHRRKGAATSGDVVIFDLDGVISDASHRQSFFAATPIDWKAFFAAGILDPPLTAGLAIARLIHTPIVILSARPAVERDATIEWLVKHDVPFDLVIVHPSGDRRSSAEFKSAEVEALRAEGYNIVLALDDDPRNVAMYRQAGIEALYVHSGYYDITI